MTAVSTPDDLSRQLRSLSIVRNGMAADAPPAVAPTKPRRRVGVSVFLALALAGTAGAGWHWRGNVQALLAAAPVADVTPAPVPAVISPVAAPVQAAGIVGSGYVVAGRQSVIGTDTGGRLSELAVAVGESVTEGQVIARLDDRQAGLALAAAEAALAGAEGAVERLTILRDQAAAYATRVERLAASGSVPATDGQEAVFALRLAEADIAAARQIIVQRQIDRDQARDQLARLTITAPFAGIILETHAVAGDLIGSSLDGGPVPGIALLLDPTSLRIDADLAETALNQVSPGQTAEVVLDAWPDQRLAGRVETILPSASLQKGTITLRIVLNAPPPEGALLANMAAKVTLRP